MRFGQLHFARRLLTKQNGAEFFSLIIARGKFFLRVGPAKIDPGWLDAEIAHKIHPQIEHLGPETGNLLVALSFLACHVRAGDQALITRVVPMCLASHAAHQPIGIKCQVADCIDSLFFRLEIIGNGRSVRPRQRCVADEIEIRLGAAGHDRQTRWDPVATFRLDVAEHSFSFKTIETFAHQHGHAMFCKIIREPRSSFRVHVAVEQMGISMHHAHFKFQPPQAGRDFTGQQPAADDHDRFLQVCHLSQGERVANRPQVDHVTEASARYRRPHRTAPHSQARFVEFDAFTVAQDRKTPLDVELSNDGAEARLDFV